MNITTELGFQCGLCQELEVSEISIFLKANKLACCSFMDAGRTPETLESEREDFIITHINNSGHSVSSFRSPSSYRTLGRGLGVTCTHSEVCFMRGTLSSRDTDLL